MKVGVVLTGMAGLLYATRGADRVEVESVESTSREEYLQHLELRPEEELRAELESMLEKKDVLGARKVVERKEVYSRIKGEEMDGYFAMAGMMLTDGVWHSRYARVFRTSELDIEQDGEMVRRLIDEIASGRFWREGNANLGEIALASLEKEWNRARGTGMDARETTLAKDVGPVIGKWLGAADRRWGMVLEGLLEKDGVVEAIVGARYNGELRRIADEELKNVLYGSLLRTEGVLGEMVEKNEELARDVIAGGLERGYWLYMDELEKVLGDEEKMRRLFGRPGVFRKAWAGYGVAGELSLRRLRELRRGGRLEEVTKAVVRRLVRSGEIDDLCRLTETADEKRVFDGLLAGGGLDGDLKEGIKKLVRGGWMYDLKWLLEAVQGRTFGELLSSGDLDMALKEGIEKLIVCGEMDDLKWLLEVLGGSVFGELLESGELDTVLREGMKNLTKRGWIYDLKWLLEVVGGRVFGELSNSGELDGKLREIVNLLVKNGWIHDLKWLTEAMKGRFEVFLRSGELDATLKEGVKKLMAGGNLSDLEMLAGIDAVKGRMSGGLAGVGELDGVFEEMVRSTDDMYGLMEAVQKGVFDGLVSRKVLAGVSRSKRARLQ